VLLDDVHHIAVTQDERRPEVEREDALHVEQVLLPRRLVEVELPFEVRLDGRLDRPLRPPKGVPLDLAHHHEDHQDHEQDHRNRPDDPPDDERRHLIGILYPLGAVSQQERGGAPERPASISLEAVAS
jgi:hypothetical protein